jgi:methyltransferase (TIGR00027 family)
LRADRPSSTARLIAAATVFLSRDPELRHRVPAGAAEICARCLSPAWLAATRLRWLPRAAERATIPGLMLHFMLRKRWIEEAVRGALDRGCRQVVILGAGFDTLAARLAPQFPAVQFIEVDHPATQAPKRAAVQRGNLQFVAADLARIPLAQALSASAYKSSERAVFVLEGLLMYLTADQVRTLFAAIGDEVVFTVMEPTPSGRIAFHNATWVERALLALWKEPFRWAVPRDRLPQFFPGWQLRAVADLAAERPELSLARGEILVHATRTA